MKHPLSTPEKKRSPKEISNKVVGGKTQRKTQNCGFVGSYFLSHRAQVVESSNTNVSIRKGRTCAEDGTGEGSTPGEHRIVSVEIPWTANLHLVRFCV